MAVGSLRALVDSLDAETREVAAAVIEALLDAGEDGYYMKLLGLEQVERKDGRAVYRLPVPRHLFNPHGVLHGGVMFAAIDTAMGAAVTSVLSPDELCFTIEAKVNYIAAVTGGSLTVEAEVVHKGGRVAVLEGRARTDDGRLAALMTASFIVSRRERV